MAKEFKTKEALEIMARAFDEYNRKMDSLIKEQNALIAEVIKSEDEQKISDILNKLSGK